MRLQATEGLDQSALLLSGLLHGSSKRMRPAIMRVEALLQDEDGQEAGGGDAAGAVVRVELWRPDAVSSVLELDQRLTITRADEAAGLIFGLPHKMLAKHALSRWAVGAPPAHCARCHECSCFLHLGNRAAR